MNFTLFYLVIRQIYKILNILMIFYIYFYTILFQGFFLPTEIYFLAYNSILLLCLSGSLKRIMV
jgi:hypothetical protein